MELLKTDFEKKPSHNQTIDQLMGEAMALESSENYQDALSVYRRLLDYDITESMRFEIFKNMGNALLKSGDIDTAEENFNKAYRIFPANQTLAINYGVLEIQRGNLGSAKEKFINVLGRDDQNDLAWVGLALVHRGHADFDLSRACMLRALDSNPLNKTALVQYYRWCKDDGVVSDLEKVQNFLASEPDDEEIQSLLTQYKS